MKENFFKNFIKEKIRRVNKTSKLRYSDIKNATKLAIESIERRLDDMSENTYVPRNEYQIQIDKLIEDIKLLRESKANLEGKASMNSVYISYALALVSIIISLIVFFT